MGCLRLTYEENENHLQVSRELESEPENWQVWVAKNTSKETKRVRVGQNGGNVYAEISNSFNETKYDYMFSENVGLNAMFNMIGHYSVSRVKDKYYFNASSAGTTSAKSQGDVTFQGNAIMMVNGKMVSSTPFVYSQGYNTSFPDGFSNLGGVSFELPTSGTVMINLEFNYHIIFGSAGQNHSSTMTIPVYIRTVGLPRN